MKYLTYYCTAFQFGKGDKNNKKMDSKIRFADHAEGVRKLAKDCSVDPRTIRNYLNGKCPNGEQYSKVRKMATERGALEFKN